MRKVGVLALVVSLVAVGACGSSGGSSGIIAPPPPPPPPPPPTCPANTICMTAGTFSPSQLTVSKSTVVGYSNPSGVDHNVVFDTPAPAGTPADVGLISSGTVNRSFDTTGAFSFHCTIHPSMTGKITVN